MAEVQYVKHKSLYTEGLRVHHVREREDLGVLKRTLGNISPDDG